MWARICCESPRQQDILRVGVNGVEELDPALVGIHKVPNIPVLHFRESFRPMVGVRTAAISGATIIEMVSPVTIGISSNTKVPRINGP